MLDGHPSLEVLPWDVANQIIPHPNHPRPDFQDYHSFSCLGKFSPSSRDIQVIKQARLKTSLQWSIDSIVYILRPHGDQEKSRVRWETLKDLVLRTTHLVCPYLFLDVRICFKIPS